MFYYGTHQRDFEISYEITSVNLPEVAKGKLSYEV